MAENAKNVTEIPAMSINTDTRDQLAHCSQQVKRRGYDKFLIVDIDAHVNEISFWPEIIDLLDDEVYKFMGESYRDRKNSPAGLMNQATGMIHQDVFGRILHAQQLAESSEDDNRNRGAVLASRAAESMGADYMVVFPTPMLELGLHPQVEMEVALGNAFNRWMTEKVAPDDPRLKGLVYLPFNDPKAAEETALRFRDDPAIIGFTVCAARYKAVTSNAYMRLYSIIEESGKPLAFHSGFTWNDTSFSQLNRFIGMHALSFVHFNMIHMTNWIVNAMPERFPKMKTIWVESGLAWIPFLMQRLDHEYLMRSSECPGLKKMPSEYMKEMYYTSQPLEKYNLDLLEGTMKSFNAETQLLYSSDWPHWDFDTPGSIYDLPFLTEEAKLNILGQNAAKLFGFEDPYKKKNEAA